MQTTFRNIKFANNIHSSGGYFMWPPGAYKPGRVPLPYPPYGTLNFFDQTASTVLNAILSHRGTGINPAQTGPVSTCSTRPPATARTRRTTRNGIIGYDFEIGATHYYDISDDRRRVRPAAPAAPLFGDSTNDCLDNEGFHEAMEFADGNYGLLRRRSTTPTTRRPRASTATGRVLANVHAGRPLHEQRGVLDLLHERRLDADHGLHRVEAEPRPGAAVAGVIAEERHAEVDRTDFKATPRQ